MAWNLGAGIDGRGIVVTGAGGGIGRAVVEVLIEAGARVTAVDLDQDGLDGMRAGMDPDRVRTVVADLRDLGSHAAILDAAAADGPLYGLVHCAAVLVRRPSPVAEVTEERTGTCSTT